MSCHEIQELLSEFVDGDLESSQQIEVERHLEGCATCRADVAALRELVDSARALRRDVQPGRDLWPEIEGSLRPRGRVLAGSWRPPAWAGLAAAAVLVAAVTLMIARQPGTRSPGEGEPIQSPSAATEEVTSETALAHYSRVSDEVRVKNGLMQVREDLLRSIGERRGELDPRTQELVDRNLEVIDQAITEIYEALEEDPENRELELLLAATYRHEVEFVKQLNLL